jgi:hypothetical protein
MVVLQRLPAFIVALAVLLIAPAAAAVRAPETTARLLAVDCGRLGDGADRGWMEAMPAPRILNLHGSVPIVTMAPFAQFLIDMGYPEASLRDPRDGAFTLSGFTNSEELAGTVAWYYERDGVRPMLIGHSQGGMRVIRTLYELSGEFHAEIAVFDPVARAPQPRTAIDDPVSGGKQPVVGLKVPFAAVLATGQLARVLLGQWDMIPRLRRIPDSAEAFTGFAIPWDPLAGTGPSPEPYVATGSAVVRNVVLPATYSHIGLPATEHLPGQPATRAWIDAYRPEVPLPALPPATDADVRNLIHAADLWYSIRHHWCREGQRLLRAQGKA